MMEPNVKSGLSVNSKQILRLVHRLVVLATLIWLSAPQGVQASPQQCAAIFKGADESAAPPARDERTRQGLIDMLIERRDIPAFIKKTPSGDLPVILVNADTVKELKLLLKDSMGTIVVQQ